MAEELERKQQAEPPFWQRPAKRLRDVGVLVLSALLASAIGVAFIFAWE
jgi:hypothetical protein